MDDRSVGVSCESMPIWVIWISINAQCRTTCRMHSKAAIVVTIKAQWYVSMSVSSRLKIFGFSVSRFSVVAFDWVDTNVVVDLATNIRSSIKTTSSMVTRWTLNGMFWWVIIPVCPVSINWNVVLPWAIRSNRWVLFFFYSLSLSQCPWIIESEYSTFSLARCFVVHNVRSFFWRYIPLISDLFVGWLRCSFSIFISLTVFSLLVDRIFIFYSLACVALMSSVGKDERCFSLINVCYFSLLNNRIRPAIFSVLNKGHHLQANWQGRFIWAQTKKRTNDDILSLLMPSLMSPSTAARIGRTHRSNKWD